MTDCSMCKPDHEKAKEIWRNPIDRLTHPLCSLHVRMAQKIGWYYVNTIKEEKGAGT